MSEYVMQPLNPKELHRMIDAVDLAVKTALKVFGKAEEWRSRSGGYFCVHHFGQYAPAALVQIGEVPAGQADAFKSHAQQNARRLTKAVVAFGHTSSWESREDDDDNIGAVRLGDYLISFFGVVPLGNEAVSLAALCLFYGGSSQYHQGATEVAALSKNPYFDRLLDALRNEVDTNGR